MPDLTFKLILVTNDASIKLAEVCNVSVKTSNSYHLDKWRYRIVYKWDMGGESVLCWAWTFLLDMDFSIIKNFKSGHYTDLRGHLLEQSKFQVSGRNHI
jgi:hypothetical protein